jgi:hypothetical protein
MYGEGAESVGHGDMSKTLHLWDESDDAGNDMPSLESVQHCSCRSLVSHVGSTERKKEISQRCA